MAQVTSGSFETTKYNSKKYLVFSWSIKSQDIAKNQTTISWSLKGAGADGYHMAGPFKVVIAGETVYSSSARIQLTNTTTVATGEKTITHNSDGAKSFSASAQAAIYSAAVNCTGSGTWELKSIPRKATITSAPNFNDEENPTINYSNLAGTSVSSLQACIASTDAKTIYVAYRDINKTGTSYTFPLTDAERKALRKIVTSGTTQDVKFYIKTVIGGENYYSSVQKTLTLINYQPTIAPTVIDVNEQTTDLTGDPNTLIRYHSNVSYTINAVAKKEATLAEVAARNGDDRQPGNTGIFEGVTSNTFNFYARDSRGNSVTQIMENVPMIEYTHLTADLSAGIALNSGTASNVDISFTISGEFFNGSFGAKNNELGFAYELYSGDEFIIGGSLPEPTITNNKYSIDYTIPLTDLDYQRSYMVRVMVGDDLEFLNVYSKQLKAIPVYDWSGEDFNFNVPLMYQGNPMDFVVEQGEKNGWTYRKWNSGLAECWYQASVSGINVGEFNLDGMYHCGSKGINFPFTFTSVDYINASGGSTGNMNFVRPFNNTNSMMTYIVVGMANRTSVTVTVNAEVKGRWK